MAGMCCGVVGEAETSSLQVDPTPRTARRRGVDARQLHLTADVSASSAETRRKRPRLDLASPLAAPAPAAAARACEGALARCVSGIKKREDSNVALNIEAELRPAPETERKFPKYGMTSVCGRRRDMEDAVAIQPSVPVSDDDSASESESHFFGVYDGHGCSHVASRCKDRLHEIVSEEVANCKDAAAWKGAMERSFVRMDEEVHEWCTGASGSDCRCELQTPQCDAVGSTAVVALLAPEKIVVANCGDSRAVLCRNGAAIPLSSDHKPDRPDELERIQAAGGRVIYWDGPRVLGVLAMSRAIGDDYLKPFVIPEPEVTVTDRTAEDECLILASDGLWDVVDNETACGVVRMCLRAQRSSASPPSPLQGETAAAASSDKACSDAAILLTKLALARHSTDNVSVVVVDLRRLR